MANFIGIEYLPKLITWQKSNSYNGIAIGIGEQEPSPYMSIFTNNNKNHYSAIAFYSLLLFNRDLTTEEIEWVKTNLMS